MKLAKAPTTLPADPRSGTPTAGSGSACSNSSAMRR